MAPLVNETPMMTMPCRSENRKSVVTSRSRTGALPSFRTRGSLGAMLRTGSSRGPRQYSRRARSAGAQSSRDRVHETRTDVRAALLVDLADARGARNIDLRHKTADDIEADEQHPRLAHLRADPGGEPAIALVERARHAARTGGEIAAIVVRGRDARERVGNRLPVDQQHAAVARFDDVGNIALGDRVLPSVVRQRLEHDAQILVGLIDHEDRAAAHAVQGFHHYASDRKSVV